jgi:hypothetical protein
MTTGTPPPEPAQPQPTLPAGRDKNETPEAYWNWLGTQQPSVISASDEELATQWRNHHGEAKAPRKRLAELRDGELKRRCSEAVARKGLSVDSDDTALRNAWAETNGQVPYNIRVANQFDAVLGKNVPKDSQPAWYERLFLMAVAWVETAARLPLVGPLFSSTRGILGLVLIVTIVCWKAGVTPSWFILPTVLVGVLFFFSMIVRSLADQLEKNNRIITFFSSIGYAAFVVIGIVATALVIVAYSVGQPAELARALHQLAGTAKPEPSIPPATHPSAPLPEVIRSDTKPLDESDVIEKKYQNEEQRKRCDQTKGLYRMGQGLRGRLAMLPDSKGKAVTIITKTSPFPSGGYPKCRVKFHFGKVAAAEVIPFLVTATPDGPHFSPLALEEELKASDVNCTFVVPKSREGDTLVVFTGMSESDFLSAKPDTSRFQLFPTSSE